MSRERWAVNEIDWYIYPKKKLDILVIFFQALFGFFGIMKGIPSPWDNRIWNYIVSLSDLSPLRNLSPVGLGAVIAAFGIFSVLGILASPASQEVCAVPMSRLYKFVYPYYIPNLLFSWFLSALCIYCSAVVPDNANPAQIIYFFIGAAGGLLYFLSICFTFNFNLSKQKKFAHSYIIEEINTNKAPGLYPIWLQHLLEDCYSCLEHKIFDNLKTILNESLTEGYGDIREIFRNDIPVGDELIRKRILFFEEQIRMWNYITNKKTKEQCLSLFALDIERLQKEINGVFSPKFVLFSKNIIDPFDRAAGFCTDATPSRIAWFSAVMQAAVKNGYTDLPEQMYAVTRGSIKSQNFCDNVNIIFHQLLLVCYICISIDERSRSQTGQYVTLMGIWKQIYTRFELTEDRFDELLNISAQAYAAINNWTYEHYLCQENLFEDVGLSVKMNISNHVISNKIHLI